MPPDPPRPDASGKPSELPPLSTVVKLTVGQLFYWDTDGKSHSCIFQFNPTELERSRAVQFTRTKTGNTLEEPGVGPRNQPKRKFTRKPEPWGMTLALRFDAGYGMRANAERSPLPKVAQSAAPVVVPERPPISFKDELERVEAAIGFFESLVEPGGRVSENQKVANADETPPTPLVILAYGQRSWLCAVKNLRIKEEDYTPNLRPRRFEVTLTVEIVETVRQNDQGKTGGVL
jgi:hypothetical protein